MKRIITVLDRHFEEVILGIFLLLITAVIFIQIIFRYLSKMPLIWPEEFSRYCLVCSTLLSLSFCVRKGIMLKVDILANLLPEFLQKILQTLILLISLALYIYLFWFSIDVVTTAKNTGQVSTAMEFPMYLLYAFCTGCFALTVLRTVQKLLLSFTKEVNNK